MVDPYAIVRRLTGHELISPKDARLLTEAVDGLIDEIGSKDARIAELEAENERLRNMLNGYGKLDAELAIAERRIEALSRAGAVKVKPLDEDDYEEIISAAAINMRKATSGIRGQMITVQDCLDWWVMKETEHRILSALEPAARDANTVASHETTNVEDKPAAPWPVSYATSTAPGRPFEPAAPEGQQPVAWGEFYGGKIVAVSLHKSYHYTVPLYTRPSEQAVTEADLDDVEKLFLAARVEADKAMRKFPQPNYVISKIAEEAGEVVKAAIHCAEGRETSENVVAEIRQAMAMLIRLYIEGDQVHGLPPLKAAMEANHEDE